MWAVWTGEDSASFCDTSVKGDVGAIGNCKYSSDFVGGVASQKCQCGYNCVGFQEGVVWGKCQGGVTLQLRAKQLAILNACLTTLTGPRVIRDVHTVAHAMKLALYHDAGLACMYTMTDNPRVEKSLHYLSCTCRFCGCVCGVVIRSVMQHFFTFSHCF